MGVPVSPSPCPVCLIERDDGICPHHLMWDEQWAESNRIMCDLLHRGKAPPRLPPEDREPVDAIVAEVIP
jgi:hypothetical protein